MGTGMQLRGVQCLSSTHEALGPPQHCLQSLGVHTCHLSTWEVKARRFSSARLSSAKQQVQGQPGMQETLKQKTLWGGDEAY